MVERGLGVALLPRTAVASDATATAEPMRAVRMKDAPPMHNFDRRLQES